MQTVASAPVTYTPKRIRWVAIPFAVLVVVLFTVMSFGLHGATGMGMGQYTRGDQSAMIGLGFVLAAAALMFTRPRVIVDAERIKVRNIVGGVDLPWSVVRAVRVDRDSPGGGRGLDGAEGGAGVARRRDGVGARAAGRRQGVRGRGRTGLEGPARRRAARLIDFSAVDHAWALFQARKRSPLVPTRAALGGRVRSTEPELGLQKLGLGSVCVLMDADDRSSGPWRTSLGPSAFSAPIET